MWLHTHSLSDRFDACIFRKVPAYQHPQVAQSVLTDVVTGSDSQNVAVCKSVLVCVSCLSDYLLLPPCRYAINKEDHIGNQGIYLGERGVIYLLLYQLSHLATPL